MTGRVRIQVGNKSIEIEGDEMLTKFETELAYMGGLLVQEGVSASVAAPVAVSPAATQGGESLDFGEMLLRLANGVTATDQMLVAGLFAQRASEENHFFTREASSLLLEQGVKVGNPSQCMTNNLKAKRVFKVGSAYRVSRSGVEYVADLGINLP
jgi:hypothetical protein